MFNMVAFFIDIFILINTYTIIITQCIFRGNSTVYICGIFKFLHSIIKNI